MEKLPIREPNYNYLKSHKKSELKVGDQVQVLRKANSKEAGWQNSWNEIMDKKRGGIFKIIKDDGIYGFELEDENDSGFCYPYFILLKN